ncbi:MAG: hypothetical protein DWQ07_21525 [Chloroflexi bacterium]|nr:MAG: hypothetical protein DWQ07_21525 [Chloroflexota bacterium]MBL1196597.1 hypothetical protein [Chloroflexota bacterium]NOH13892.1 hypothetical protein [Chloroflexota bacterium]
MKRFLEMINWKLVGIWVLMGVLLRIFNNQLTASQLPANLQFVLAICLRVIFYWIVLRKYVQRIGLWSLATIAGMLVVRLVHMNLGGLFDQLYSDAIPILAAFLIFPLYGAFLMFIRAFFQWIVLRKEVQRAYYWIIGSVVANIIEGQLGSFLVFEWLSGSISLPYFYIPSVEFIVYSVFLVITGMVMASLFPSVESTHNQRLELETI